MAKVRSYRLFDIEISYKGISRRCTTCSSGLSLSSSDKNTEATTVNDLEEQAGTETGKCSFIVLTGEGYSTKVKALKAITLKNITYNGSVLATGLKKEPELIYRNPQLFIQMLPWLFPYGLGDIGYSS